MDSSNDKKRMDVEGDRLSNLSDELIHKILSFIGTKPVVQTSVLSSRWRFIWTTMPYLNFSTEGFPTFPKFSEFVTHVLSFRNNLVDVFSINLRYCEKVNNVGFKQIMKYAVSHNIQQLNIACLPDEKVEFSSYLFSSQTLKHLSLTKEPVSAWDLRMRCTDLCLVTTMSTWELPALTSLYLDDVTLCCDENTDNCDGLFSKCTNLKNLTLKSCNSYESISLCIFHPVLSTLTIENYHGSSINFNVVAPRLKNLSLRGWGAHQYLISAPELKSFQYKGWFSVKLSTEGFHSLEKADICVYQKHAADALGIVCMLEQLRSVKFLTLNLELVELLSSSVKVISNHPSPFVNLKSLKIHPVNKLSGEEQKNVKMSTEVKKYLLGSSPNATLTMVSREDILAMENTKLAQKLMAELRVLLEGEKVKTEAKRVEMEIKMHPQIGGTTAQIKNFWEDLSVQIEQKKDKAFLIISSLENIERLLTKLPASNRAIIQPCFSSLFADANIVMSKLTEHMKSHCDENQSRLRLCFHEPGTI